MSKTVGNCRHTSPSLLQAKHPLTPTMSRLICLALYYLGRFSSVHSHLSMSIFESGSCDFIKYLNHGLASVEHSGTISLLNLHPIKILCNFKFQLKCHHLDVNIIFTQLGSSHLIFIHIANMSSTIYIK